MNNRSFIRSSPLHVVHILKYPIALQRERRDHELKLRRYAGTTCTIHEAVIECTAYVHIGMRRQKCTQICDLLHSLPSICTTIPYTSVAQPIGACEHRVEYYTRYKLRALPPAKLYKAQIACVSSTVMMGDQSLRMSHAVSYT